jgi:hypothetical protein
VLIPPEWQSRSALDAIPALTDVASFALPELKFAGLSKLAALTMIPSELNIGEKTLQRVAGGWSTLCWEAT